MRKNKSKQAEISREKKSEQGHYRVARREPTCFWWSFRRELGSNLFHFTVLSETLASDWLSTKIYHIKYVDIPKTHLALTPFWLESKK